MPFSLSVLECAMEAALDEARRAAEAGELPYGAVVVSRSRAIVARSQDRVLRDNDPTRHAEIEAVRRAVAAIGPDLSDHALVSNVEGCAMCVTAAWTARIGAIAYGLSQAEVFAIRPDAMDEPGLTVAESQAPFRRRAEEHRNVCHAAAKAIWAGANAT
jgi:tRNA(Arg) A34 adenosine deaminase TadA